MITLLRDEERLLLSGPDLQKRDNELEYTPKSGLRIIAFWLFFQRAGMTCRTFSVEKDGCNTMCCEISTQSPKERILSREEHNLFYAYLCLKNELRKQMVQVNERVGFDNFQVFEQRKGFFFPAQLRVRKVKRSTRGAVNHSELKLS